MYGVAMKPFKEGDRVRCINALHTGYLKNGEIYTITKIDQNTCACAYVSILGNWYYMKRFELTNQYPTLRGDYEAIQRG